MFCQKCGHELPDNALRCSQCGEIPTTKNKIFGRFLHLVAMIPIISVIVVWWWILRIKSWNKFSLGHPMVNIIIVISSGISVGLIAWAGLSQLLSFIPESWGSFSGEGEWTPLSITLSTIVAVIAGFLFVYTINRIKGMEKRIKSEDQVKKEPNGKPEDTVNDKSEDETQVTTEHSPEMTK